MTRNQSRIITKWSRLIATAIVPTAGLQIAVKLLDDTIDGPNDERAITSMRLVKCLKGAAIKINPGVQDLGIRI